MQFIKTHLISLLCGVAGLGLLGVTTWGMMVTTVKDEMQKRARAAGKIQTLQRNPKNQELIAAEKLRGDRFQTEFEATVAIANEINYRQPLMPGVFPKPESRSTPYAFRLQYQGALRGFSVTLLADGPPTEDDIDEEEENVADLLAMEDELEAENAPKDEEKNTRQPVRRRGSRRGLRRAAQPQTAFGEGAIGMPMTEGAMPMSEVGHGSVPIGRGGRGGARFPTPRRTQTFRAPGDEPKYDPQYRAMVAKARNIRCYAEPDRSFHVSPAAINKQSAPTPKEMWEAQVSLWIQQDVVDAIAEINNKAALAVREGDAFVEQMPVKRIEFLQVHGYVRPEDPKNRDGSYYAFTSVSGDRRAAKDNQPPNSFTDRKPDDQFDVLHFTLAVFVDQRELLGLIDHISRKNFYKCVELDYRKLDPKDEAGGYMYGTGPVIRAEIRFEAYMARRLYAPLMPKTVRDILGIKDKG